MHDRTPNRPFRPGNTPSPAQTRHGRNSARRPERAGLPGSAVPARRRGHAAARRLAPARRAAPRPATEHPAVTR